MLKSAPARPVITRGDELNPASPARPRTYAQERLQHYIDELDALRATRFASGVNAQALLGRYDEASRNVKVWYDLVLSEQAGAANFNHVGNALTPEYGQAQGGR